MSMYRALAPFRKAHFLRPRGTSSFTDLFERDPFFAGIAPMLNAEFSPLRYNYPRVNIKESPTAYNLEAEIPGFRRENLSIEFLDSRTLRISGKRGGKAAPAVEETEGEYAASEKVADPVASEEAVLTESAKNDTEIPESASKDVAQAEEEYQVVETERNEEFSFTRQWWLPEVVDQEAVRASLDHGILSVTLPKLRAEAARKIIID
jgi:HSP20 family protein